MSEIEQNEKDRIFCRHNISHSLDVARIAALMAADEGIHIDRELIYAAALLHDIGRAKTADNHREKSWELAEDILISCGFSDEERTEIKYAIIYHGDENSSDESSFRGIFCKADKLSRNCFMCRAKKECYWNADKKNLYIRV